MLTSIIKLQVGDTENRSKHLRGLINWKPRGKKNRRQKGNTHRLLYISITFEAKVCRGEFKWSWDFRNKDK